MTAQWSLSLKTAPTAEPVSLAEVKDHLRVDWSEEDALIQGLLEAAVEYAETATNRAIPEQTWYLKLDSFPNCGPIVIPKPPCLEVVAITYVDANGVTQTWDSDDYQVAAPEGPKAQHARVCPAYALTYPIARCQPEAVTVEFTCGYGDAVPASIKAAIKILVAHWYGPGREAVVVGSISSDIQLTVDALLMPYTCPRW